MMEGIQGIIERDYSEADRLAKIARKKLETTRVLLNASLFMLISSGILVVAKLMDVVPFWKPAVFMVVGFIILTVCNKFNNQVEGMNKKRKVLLDGLYIGIERKN